MDRYLYALAYLGGFLIIPAFLVLAFFSIGYWPYIFFGALLFVFIMGMFGFSADSSSSSSNESKSLEGVYTIYSQGSDGTKVDRHIVNKDF